jgi:fructose-bisphosphate aldolase class I
VNEEQRNVMASGRGFIAALDQSGGSTPKALKLYGIAEDAYHGDEQMFDLIHQMRERLMSSPGFSGDKILATILFEQTMDRAINGEDTAAFLWKQKHIVPFVKVDQGLSDAENGVQLMKPMTKLDSLLERAVDKGIFGTKMRSFIQEPNDGGIKAIVDQQFDYAHKIAERGLMPIIEPEVSIKCPDKPQADSLLVAALKGKLDELPGEGQVMLKLTLPDENDLYAPLIEHPRVLRVVVRRLQPRGKLRDPGPQSPPHRELFAGLDPGADDRPERCGLRREAQIEYRPDLRRLADITGGRGFHSITSIAIRRALPRG